MSIFHRPCDCDFCRWRYMEYPDKGTMKVLRDAVTKSFDCFIKLKEKFDMSIKRRSPEEIRAGGTTSNPENLTPIVPKSDECTHGRKYICLECQKEREAMTNRAAPRVENQYDATIHCNHGVKFKEHCLACNREKLLDTPGKAVSLDDPKKLIEHPPHYNFSEIEPIDVIEAWKLGFHLGNVVKYVARAKHKGDLIENLEKARWYLDRAIQKLREGKELNGTR